MFLIDFVTAYKCYLIKGSKLKTSLFAYKLKTSKYFSCADREGFCAFKNSLTPRIIVFNRGTKHFIICF